jgi:hypothetical protein
MTLSKAFIILAICTLFFTACVKNNIQDNTQLSGQWTFISSTGNFPTHPAINFHTTSTTADHMVFGLNDTVYTYQPELTAPYNNDTAYFTITANNTNLLLFVRDSTINGIVFKYINSTGVAVDTSLITVDYLANNKLVLTFPTYGLDTAGGVNNYYAGSILDSLTK